MPLPVLILNIALTAVGAALMVVGVAMLSRWERGEGEGESSPRPQAAQSDWILMDLRFLALVIAPLLGGAVLIVFAIVRWF